MYAKMIHESLWMIISSLIATYIAFSVMNRIMQSFKIGFYKGSSVFTRYILSTLPGEIVFSLVFSILCFSTTQPFDKIMNIFLTSSIIKMIISLIFSVLMVVIFKIGSYSVYVNERQYVKS